LEKDANYVVKTDDMKMGIKIRQILDQLADNHIVSEVELTFFDKTFHRYICKILCKLIPSNYKLHIRLI
jgi:hypothetical protein